MRKILFIAVLVSALAGPAFAEFEFEFGFYGGLGNAASVGLDMQLGYISPAENAGGEPAAVRWGLLADMGFGYQYGLSGTTFTENSGYPLYEDSETAYHDALDYNLGLLAEFYFLPFMGIAAGGGFARGLLDEDFVPYFRVQLPFLFGAAKLGLGFDYILWKGDALPQGTDVPPGYRVNLFIHLRGRSAWELFLNWFS